MGATVVIAGGGPAGMMAGLGLARRGIDVIVVEKHADFFRDFRGDTVHPSTLDVIDQLGLRERFDAIDHHSVGSLDVVLDGLRVTPVNFAKLPGPNKQIALMPQWDLLTLLADAGRETGNLRVLMSTSAAGLIKKDGAVRGLKARDADGDFEITAALTIVASGRGCPLTDHAHLESQEFGVPIDVLWFRLPAPSPRPPDTIVYLSPDVTVLTIPRTDYFQCGRLIEKGGFAGLKLRGLDAFRADLVRGAPVLKDVVADLTDWDDVKLLSVRVDRLTQWWQPGLLAIGDAAHGMSPAFGVGINYAIQDAVAAVNELAGPLAAGAAGADLVPHLQRVQKRRVPPVKLMQPIQLRLHAVIARPGGGAIIHNPPRWYERALLAVLLPILRPIATRVIGRGFRPERFTTLDPVVTARVPERVE